MATITSINKEPGVDKVVILLIGGRGVGKHRLATALIQTRSSLTVEVRTCVKLPLPKENEQERPYIDLIIFIVDMTSRASKMILEESLPYLMPECFVDKVCFVAMNSSMVNSYSFGIDRVIDCGDLYGCPVLYGDLQSRSHLDNLAQQIINQAEVKAGLKYNISSNFVTASFHGP
ncbi:centromere protein M-like [Limulus polyphemus]|uniref:Centromere protein M n=1 Tax=Limulus polyphemus TaxID=6850 RepID=A0ABM1BCM9_LIMPO|nr:centromere protein M-like [Limulus polyphemus]